MSTVRPDGVPHLIPIWFSWDGEAILIASKPDAQKVRNIRENPVVMLALGRPDEDFDVGLLEGGAELLDVPSVGAPAGLAPREVPGADGGDRTDARRVPRDVHAR